MDFIAIFLTWLKEHLGVVFMGIAGATVTALTPSEKRVIDRVSGWIVGVILCAALSAPTSSFLTSGDYVEVFGFIYGMGGMTLAKMLLKAIEKRSKVELESKTGIKLDDDAN